MLETLKAKLAELYAKEPARVNAAVVTAVLAVAGVIGIVVAPAALAVIGSIVALLVPIVVAELTRPKVVPNVVVEGVAADAFLAGANEGAKAVQEATGPSTTEPLPGDSLGP